MRFQALAGPARVLRGEAGASILEVLITALVVGIAAAGIALMFSMGNTFVLAEGDQRVAMLLGQQKIEQLRALGFGCVPVAGPASTQPVNGGGGCTNQRYDEPPWEAAGGGTAPAPSNRLYTRRTCVQFVSDADFGSPAYTGGATATTCPAGTASNTKRITVVVAPTTMAVGQPEPIILQGWVTTVPGGM